MLSIDIFNTSWMAKQKVLCMVMGAVREGRVSSNVMFKGLADRDIAPPALKLPGFNAQQWSGKGTLVYY